MFADKMQYSGLCREWASHGIMVAAIDHHCGTCNHTINGETGNVVSFDREKLVFDYPCRNSQVKTLAKEISMLIDSVTKPEFMKKIFNSEVTTEIDLDQIFMAGHSHGGMTSMVVGTQESRIKAVISLDPWFFPFSEEIKKDDFHYSDKNPPILVIRSDTFRA